MLRVGGLAFSLLQQQVDKAADQPALSWGAMEQLSLNVRLQIVGGILFCSQQHLVRGDSQRIAQLHQCFQAGDGAGIFDVGDVDVGQVGFFGELLLGHTALFAEQCNPFADRRIIDCQIHHLCYKSIGKSLTKE